LWNQFEAAIDQIAIDKLFAEKIAQVLNESHERACEATKGEMAESRNLLEQLDVRRDRLFDLFVANEMDRSDYERQNMRLKDQRNEIMSSLERAQLKINGAYMETAKSVLELATNAKTLWNQRSPEERREFLGLILSNQWLEGLTVRFELKKPLQVLSQMAQKQNWRPQRDSNSCPYRERVMS